MLPDDVDSQVRRVAHVTCIEAVVAQLVKEYFVGGEVVCSGRLLQEGVDCQQEGAFAELVLVQPVCNVAYRADGEYKGATQFGQFAEKGLPCVDDLGYTEWCASKLLWGQFVAVRNGPSLVRPRGKLVDKNCAEGDEDNGVLKELLMGLMDGLVAALQAGVGVRVGEPGVVHP